MLGLKIAAFLIACLALGQQIEAFRYNFCKLNAIGVIPDAAHLDVCADATGDHCVVNRGANVTYTMSFHTVRPFEKATFRVSQVSLTNQYQVFDTVDACGGPGGLKCPSDEEDKQTFSASLIFNKDFPTGMQNCRFELIDENEEPIMCKQFLARVE